MPKSKDKPVKPPKPSKKEKLSKAWRNPNAKQKKLIDLVDTDAADNEITTAALDAFEVKQKVELG